MIYSVIDAGGSINLVLRNQDGEAIAKIWDGDVDTQIQEHQYLKAGTYFLDAQLQSGSEVTYNIEYSLSPEDQGGGSDSREGTHFINTEADLLAQGYGNLGSLQRGQKLQVSNWVGNPVKRGESPWNPSNWGWGGSNKSANNNDQWLFEVGGDDGKSQDVTFLLKRDNTLTYDYTTTWSDYYNTTRGDSRQEFTDHTTGETWGELQLIAPPGRSWQW